MPPAVKAAPKSKVEKSGTRAKTHVFENLPVFGWKVKPDQLDERGNVKKRFDRPYVMIHGPYGFIRQWIYVVPYSSEDGSGWQRDISAIHARNLCTAMDDDDFTPTVWASSADEWQMKHKTDVATDPHIHPEINFKVSEDHKIRITDGNHRSDALRRLRDKAQAKGDLEQVRLIDETPISIQVFLSPQHYMSDFIRLQKGKSVSRTQIQSMVIQIGAVDPDKMPYFKLGTDVARLLDKNPQGFLFNDIVFDTRDGDKSIQYSSLITDNSSSYATTLYGGALIGDAFVKDAAWMAARYVEVYNSLKGVKDQRNENRRVFCTAGQKLCPKFDGGKKGGTHLMIGIGNCFIWKMSFLGVDAPTESDLRDVDEAAMKSLDKPSGGGSASDKRKDMGKFAKEYFKSLVNSEDNPVPAIEGVPIDLIALTSASTWGITSKSTSYKKWKEKMKEEEEEEKKKAKVASTEYDKSDNQDVEEEESE